MIWFLISVVSVSHAQRLFLDVSPRAMLTTMYADAGMARSGIVPLITVAIFPKPHFGVGFFGTSIRKYTTTGIEFIATTNRNKGLIVYGLTSIYFIESNLENKYGLSLSTIGGGLGVGAGVSVKLHKNIAITLAELTYQNHAFAITYLFGSNTTVAEYAISVETGIVFRFIDRDPR